MVRCDALPTSSKVCSLRDTTIEFQDQVPFCQKDSTTVRRTTRKFNQDKRGAKFKQISKHGFISVANLRMLVWFNEIRI
jgi:hypothetical protein